MGAVNAGTTVSVQPGTWKPIGVRADRSTLVLAQDVSTGASRVTW